jgi:hypothetical protein
MDHRIVARGNRGSSGMNQGQGHFTHKTLGATVAKSGTAQASNCRDGQQADNGHDDGEFQKTHGSPRRSASSHESHFVFVTVHGGAI